MARSFSLLWLKKAIYLPKSEGNASCSQEQPLKVMT